MMHILELNTLCLVQHCLLLQAQVFFDYITATLADFASSPLVFSIYGRPLRPRQGD